jgi:outer membrane protein assembly factor BamB
MKSRTRVLAAAVVTAVAGMVGSNVAGAVSQSSPWWQTDHDASRNRYNAAETVLTSANVDDAHWLRSIVARPTGPSTGCAGAGISAPVLAGGRVYAVATGRVVAYDARTGRQLWRHLLDETSSTYPALVVSAGRVLVDELDCGSVSDPNSAVIALDADTGSVVWDNHQSPIFGAVTSIATYGGKLVMTGGSPGSGGIVSVRSVATGATVWERNLTACIVQGPALVAHELVVYRSCDDEGGNPVLTAARIADGSVVWTRTGDWMPQRADSPRLAARHLYAQNPAGATADLNPATGVTRATLSGAGQTLAVDAGRVYATCASGTKVCAYHIGDHTLAWSTDGAGPIAVAGDVVYLANGEALRAAGGGVVATLWDGDPATFLLVGDGRVAAVTDPRILDLYGLKGF